MMMTINANTKIASLLKHSPAALEAIVSISPKFTRLRNPILRKVIAGRTSIAMAAMVGGCSVDDFFDKLQLLGFDIDKNIAASATIKKEKLLPPFMENIQRDKLSELDVRPIIETGKDPLNIILEKVKALEPGHILKIINSFEPTPLIHLLGKQGFEAYAEAISGELVHTYFYKKAATSRIIDQQEAGWSKDWDEVLDRFKHKLETIDVRALEMPLPMHAILDALKTLPAGNALFVYHKRIPVFLLPELKEQGFSFRIKETGEGAVQLLVYKD